MDLSIVRSWPVLAAIALFLLLSAPASCRVLPTAVDNSNTGQDAVSLINIMHSLNPSSLHEDVPLTSEYLSGLSHYCRIYMEDSKAEAKAVVPAAVEWSCSKTSTDGQQTIKDAEPLPHVPSAIWIDASIEQY